MIEHRTVFLPGRSGLYKPSELARCPLCDKRLEKVGMAEHVKSVCPKRKVGVS